MTDWFAGKPIPNFDVDLPRGQVSERLVEHLCVTGDRVRIEVKTFRHPSKDAFVELWQQKKGSGSWVPSGLSLRRDDWWVFIDQAHLSMHWFSTEVLREAVRRERTKGRKPSKAGLRGDNPTAGFWFPFQSLEAIAQEMRKHIHVKEMA